MLRNILKEIGRAFHENKTPAKGPLDSKADLRPVFQASSTEERHALVGMLQRRVDDDPSDLDGWTLLGDWHVQLQQHANAELAYRAALKLQPLHARAQEGLGLALLYLGRLEESYLHLETACKVNPSNAEAWTHWGLVELELGNLGEAAGKFQRAIERHPENPHAWHNLGLVAYRQGRSTESVQYLERSLSLKPDHGLAYSNLALAALRCEDLTKASLAAHKATELKRENSRVWTVHGDVAMAAGDYGTAASSFAKAAALSPSTAGPWIGLGKLHMSTGLLDEADRAFLRAITLESANAEACAARGQLQLLRGHWQEGWDLYEARRKTVSTPVRAMPWPEWQGEDLTGRRILVHAEQGLGDIILFASCIPDLLGRGAHCVLEAPPRLHSLFARSFPEAQVVRHEPTGTQGDWLNLLGPIDLHVPIGTLPRYLRRDTASFPARSPYLKHDEEQGSRWSVRLGERNGPRIGITWQGGLLTTARQQRSLPALDLARALAQAGATLVCLQHGEVLNELVLLERDHGLKVHPGISGFADLDDVAALTATLDGVVTVCCTQAHLTGALGIPGLVLVPTNPNWRYGSTGDEMPWYPSLRLVRQTAASDWHSPLRVAAEWVRAIRDGNADGLLP